MEGAARKPRTEAAVQRAIRRWRAAVVAPEVERAPAEARLPLRLEAEALAAAVRRAAGERLPPPAPGVPEGEEPPSAPLVRLGHVLSLRQGLLDALAAEVPPPRRAAALLAAGDAIGSRLTWLARAAAEEAAALGATLLSLRGLFENLRDGLVFVDRRGIVQDLNRSAAEQTGLSREEIVGRRFSDVWPSPKDHPFEPLYRRVLETGATETVYDLEYQPVGAEKPIVFDLVVAPRILAGETIGTVSIVHYRTEQRQLERELRHSEKMASIGQLATGIAHELKNLLAGIRGYAEIGREGELDAARAFAKIVAVTERASRLTDGLLAFSRKARPRVEPVDLDRLVDDVLDLALTKKARRGIRVSREVEDGLPRALCDANQIEQVLLNLVLNALEAMRTTGGGALRIRLARAGGDMVEVSVADTGPGIAPEVQARIFEPFFTTKAGFGPGRVAGTGLGLSVSRGIVEQHGGTIEVESAPGAGARFTVRLPAAPGVAPPAPAAPAAAPAAASRPRSSARVLVADDEAVIRDVIRRVLRKAGCEVKTARSIGRARKLLSAGPFDLLFLDLVIPGMRGFATLRKLKRRYPGLRVVVVTGQALGEDALAKVREITDGYIEKPFPLAAIIEAVEQAVAPA